jgi:LPS sulfotransferase NodH
MLLVTGPTRTGTTLLARLLDAAGVAVDPDRHYFPQVRGGYEHRSAVAGSDAALRGDPGAAKRHLSALTAPAVKDPRPCWYGEPRVAEAWADAFPGLRVLLSTRDPGAVAASRLASAGYFREEREAGELADLVAARVALFRLTCARLGVPLLEISFPQWLRDPRALHAAFADFGGVPLPPADECAALWDALVDPSLVHH